MNEQRKRIAAIALLWVAVTTYAVLYAVQSSTIINFYQKTTTVSKDTFWKVLNYSKKGLQQLNDGIKQILSMGNTSVIGVKQILSTENASVVGSPSEKEAGVIDVAILIATTTNKVKNPTLQTLTLTTECLPSIIATAESIYNYKVYIGTEHYDYLATHLDKIKSMSVGNVEMIPMVVKGGNMNAVTNEIARQAYKEGAEYMCRVNDDTKFITKNWTTFGIKMLLNYDPTNVGVVGPTCNQGNTDIMTHDMVHRTHLGIFNYYYPPVFENYYIDDWMTSVYKPNRSTKLKTWEVIHSLKQGTRYTADFSLESFVAILVTIGKVAIESYIKEKPSCQKYRIISYCLFGSEHRFIEGAVANIKIASQIFPGWIVRIYHDDTVPYKTLETIKSDHVQLVNFNTDKPLEPKQIWNLFVASDPCLERYLICNIDSRLTAREKAAVDQWIDSGKPFHIMRDHPFHVNHFIPSYLWGGVKDAVPNMMSLIHKYVKKGTHNGTVQQFLNREIWPIAKMSAFQPDIISL